MAKSIQIGNVKAKHVIEGLAEAFSNSKYCKDHHQYTMKIDEAYGQGYIKAFKLDYGVTAYETDCLFHEDVEIVIERGNIHVLKFLFCMDNHLHHKFSDDKEYTTISRLENLIMADSPTNTHQFIFPADTSLCLFVIDINRKLFEEKIESFIEEMPDELLELFRDVNGINNFIYKNFYSLEIAKCINDFKECDHTDFVNKVFLEGKVYEILAETLRQYLDDKNEPDKKNIIRQATKERVNKAIQIIEDEIDQMDNIAELAKRVNLNPNTLQKAFKTIYDTSVNEFIRNYRIEKAKKLIENTEANITEIAYQIGINSRSYFSKLFKDYYGMSPKKYAEQYRNGSKNEKDQKSA